ncbi:RHS repeat domain-containing protein [Citrobacter portucalensis]|uniref:RHS repeat domain-containing protein n=1 Tax=Citrobacter portucalensis TaxID=1639133 RepID=UPI001F3AD68D|nr:RHS repeat-associated core domain-containing protein [Citrobacter portucalensis]
MTENDQVSHTTWKYDVNGRLVEKRVDKGGYRPLQWRYRWDARSQLTGLETPEGERWEYKHDPFGRRISKRCTNRNKPGMDFHWNGDQLTGEIPVGPDGKPEDENAIRWIYEPGSFTPLARYEKGQLHYAITDIVGRIQELLTEDGTIVWRGKQQLWGQEESRRKEDGPTCRLRFPGQYEDTESGLYYNRFRYYDCDTGQYVSIDPIGLAGGLNLYQYAPNPISWIDPLGLTACSKNAKSLREGPQGTVVTVKSKQEAHDLLMEAFPDAQKVRGIGSQDAAGIRRKHKMEQFKKRDGTVRYRKDYPIDSNTGRVYGHDDPKGTGHGSLPHINIKRSDGTMVRIDIDG